MDILILDSERTRRDELQNTLEFLEHVTIPSEAQDWQQTIDDYRVDCAMVVATRTLEGFIVVELTVAS